MKTKIKVFLIALALLPITPMLAVVSVIIIGAFE